MASSGPGANASYLFLVILIILIIRRMSMVVKGSKVSRSRAIAFSVYYVAFAGVFLASSFFEGVSPYLLALYLAVGAAAIYGSYRFTDRRVVFWKDAEGSVWMKGAVIIYVIYVAGLITRIAIDFLFLGSPFSFSGAAAAALSPTEINAIIATDLLLTFGVGLLLGRNVRVLKHYSLILGGKEQAPDSPPS
jgi:hypothetical protein